MNLISLTQTRNLFDMLTQIKEMHREQKFEEALVLTEKALRSEALFSSKDPGDARIHFLYCKAVALDILGKVEEAFHIFEKLVNDYPGTPEFESSIQIICAKLQDEAKVLIKEDLNHPKILETLTRLERHTMPPYWLLHAVAAREISEGKVEVGLKRIQNVLALSPNDSDYLRCAISLAQSCGRNHEAHKMLDHARELLEERPYRFDLLRLLEDEVLTEEKLMS